MTLVYLSLAWLVGLLFGFRLEVSWWLWLIPGGLSLAGIFAARQRPELRVIFACALTASVGALRFSLAVPSFDESNLAYYNDQGFATIEGVIVEPPVTRDNQITLAVRAESITLDEGPVRPIKGLLLVQAPRTHAYRYGDPVMLRGELRTPPEFDTFSYRDYLARQRIYSIMQYAQIEVTGPRRGHPVRTALLDFRRQAHAVIIRLLPDPQASLLAGILLGIESDISPTVRESFNAVSATHVIAISGSNLVILAGVIQALARRVFKKSAWIAVVTILVLFVYAAFVGGDAAVMRAAIMAALGLVAVQLGRQTYGLASLGFAALLMTAIDPYLLWDIGFQLSFLATLGLILYVEPLQKLLESGLSSFMEESTARKIVFGVSDAFLVTIAAQITTTPIMAATFGRFSLLALPVNLLIVPAQPPVMILGGVAVLLAMVVWPLGQVLAWGSWLFLTWTIEVVHSFARLPFASFDVGFVPPIYIWAIYIIMFTATYYAMQPEEDRTRFRQWVNRAFSFKAVSFAGVIVSALLWVVV